MSAKRITPSIKKKIASSIQTGLLQVGLLRGCALGVVALGLASTSMMAQDLSSLTGSVTDSTGAAIPGVAVTLTDTRTNSIYAVKTSSTGDYTITSLRPGEGFKVTFEAAGFQPLTVSEIQVGVGRTVTQNARLSAGATQTVEVSAGNKSATLDTVDASIGNNLDVKILNDLPILSRDSITVLFQLQPGITNGAVTGARTDQNETTVDGLDVNDIAAGQAAGVNGYAIISKAPVDSVEEFRGTVAGQLASNGPGGGGQFQLVTKSGTNAFHGDINEYHRDANLQANAWFNDLNGIAKAPFIQNQFGGALGGPILRDKLFFFFDFNESRIKTSQQAAIVVPLDSYRNGTVNYINNNAGCTSSSRLNTTPSCISSLTPAQVAALDPQKVGINSGLFNYVNARYPHANDLTGGNGYNTGFYRFNAPAPDNQTTYVLHLDYNLTHTQKLSARGTVNRRDSTQTVARFPGDPVSNPFTDRSYSYVATHVWQIGGNKVNTLLYGSTITKFNFPSLYDPTGTTSLTLGGLGAPYNTLSTQTRRVPIPELRDDFNWTKGAHQLQAGGTFKAIKTHSLLLNDFNFATIGLGGNTSSLNASLRPTNILNTTTAVSGYDTAFTFGLGRVGSISSNYNYDNKGNVLAQGSGATRRYRYYQTELYAGDTWKATRKLTLTYGLRYQYYSVPFEANGNQSVQNLGFDDYFKARVAQSAANQTGAATVPFLVYQLGGKANNGPSVYQPNWKDFAPRLAFAYSATPKTIINGGGGVVFDRTVINAVNFIQDQSSYLFQQNSVAQPYGNSADPVGSLRTDPRVGANFATTFAIPAPPAAPAIVNPFTPNVTAAGIPNGLALGRGQSAVDSHLKDPYSIAFNAGIQQDMGAGFILKMNYVGRLGRRLLAQADASQLIDTRDAASGQSLVTAFSNLTLASRAGVPVSSSATIRTVTPQPFFENQGGANTTQQYYNIYAASLIKLGDFGDFVKALSAAGRIGYNAGMASQFSTDSFLTNKGFSSYNGLLITVSKNLNHGLQFDVNYTWSHSVDNTSLPANSIAANTGLGFICDVTQPRACRANSDFDITTVINSNFVYQLPVGRGRTFLGNAPRWVDEAIGGWSVSGIPQYRSGLTFNTTTGAYIAGYSSNSPGVFNGDRSAVAGKAAKVTTGALANSVNLFRSNTAAAAAFSDPLGLNLGSRNNLRGPSLVGFDASLAKTFPLVGDRVVAKFHADAFNVLNHPVFANPVTTDINSGSFGQITGVAVASRVLQVSLRVEF